MADYHQILEIPSDASGAEIKAAYRRLAKKYHPDVSQEPDAAKRFVEITDAYEHLLHDGQQSNDPADYYYPEPLTKEELRRARAAAFAKQRFEQFKKNNEAFRKSWYFVPLKWIVYTILIVAGIASIALFFLGIKILVKDSGIAGIPMLLGGAYCSKKIWELFQSLRPWFDKKGFEQFGKNSPGKYYKF